MFPRVAHASHAQYDAQVAQQVHRTQCYSDHQHTLRNILPPRPQNRQRHEYVALRRVHGEKRQYGHQAAYSVKINNVTGDPLPKVQK